jgi:hypothetical protein
MYLLFFILLIFSCLVVVGIKYDRVVPPFLNLVKRKRLNVWYLLLGIFFVFVSFISLSEKAGFEKFSPGAQSSERWGFPVHNRLLFAVIFICGLLAILSAFLEKPNTKIDGDEHGYNKICISCGSILQMTLEGSGNCPKCGGAVEIIDGVLERHPELLEKMKKTP